MMLTIGLLYLSLFALAARMQRHRPVLLGPWHGHALIRHLELAGWMILGLSLLSLWRWDDMGMALIAWVGLLPLLAGILLLGMSYHQILPRAALGVAAAMTIAGLASPG